jgi:L-ribulose-5-phosphate 3-epimerase
MNQHPDNNQRRSFLKKLAAGVAGGTLIPLSALAERRSSARNANNSGNINLGISSYSYWHFYSERTPLRYVIEEASRLGVSGVDVLHRQMESEDADYIKALKRHALLHGVHLNCLSTHQRFLNPDREERQQSIDDTKRFIRVARDLGASCIRISTGRWGTTGSFSELMDLRGIEPPIEGYTDEDAFEWCVDALEQLVPVAEEHGVMLGLENHWGLTTTADGLLRLFNAVESPWLGVLMDTGNFLDDRYEQLERIAPHTVFIQAKTYYGGGRFYTLDLDYDRIAGILNDVGYKGYISIEFEGHAPNEEAVEDSISMLRSAFSV